MGAPAVEKLGSLCCTVVSGEGLSDKCLPHEPRVKGEAPRRMVKLSGGWKGVCHPSIPVS